MSAGDNLTLEKLEKALEPMRAADPRYWPHEFRETDVIELLIAETAALTEDGVNKVIMYVPRGTMARLHELMFGEPPKSRITTFDGIPVFYSDTMEVDSA